MTALHPDLGFYFMGGGPYDGLRFMARDVPAFSEGATRQGSFVQFSFIERNPAGGPPLWFDVVGGCKMYVIGDSGDTYQPEQRYKHVGMDGDTIVYQFVPLSKLGA